MTVRVVRTRHPRPGDRHDQPYEEVLTFETAYQIGDRLIAVDPVDEVRAAGPRQFTRHHLIEVDFERLTLIPYQQMVSELPGEIRCVSADDVDRSVEKLS